MTKPTINEIARRDADAGGYYLSRNTLLFFGQTLQDFQVLEIDDEIFIAAEAVVRVDTKKWSIGKVKESGRIVGATLDERDVVMKELRKHEHSSTVS
jgi:hypothetical protein